MTAQSVLANVRPPAGSPAVEAPAKNLDLNVRAIGTEALTTLPHSLVPLRADESWVDQALCAQTDPEVFFPEKGGSTRVAKRVCGRCPVISECLSVALEFNEGYGIWGGKSPTERRNLLTRALNKTMAAGHAVSGRASPAPAGSVNQPAA